MSQENAINAPNRPSTKLDVLEALPQKISDLPEVCANADLAPFYGQNKYMGYCSNFYEKSFSFPVAILGIPLLIKEFGKFIEFKTSEACFMFLKGATFLDRNPGKNIAIMHKIIAASKPSDAKSFGRELDCRPLNKKGRFDDATWVKERCKCMYDAIFYKFNSENYKSEVAELMQEKRHLVEATQNDRVWGNGLHITDKDLYIPANWKGVDQRTKKSWFGLNLLGETLMVFQNEMKDNY